MNDLVIADWADLHARLKTFNEKELLEIINHEVATYHRKTIIERLHMRYCKLRSKREREMMMMGVPAL